jgi:ABC-type proline/glycine betaine transport system ATPase subunit
MIEFRRVTKQYPDGTLAVEDVDIVIPPHKTTVLVGSSGSGKTTLLRMINRMVDPTSGEVLIDGRDVATVDPVQLRRGIGYVMQNSGLLPHRKVIDNVATVPVVTRVTDGWPGSSNREIVWRQRRRPRIDRNAEDQAPEPLRGDGDKVMSGGATKVVPR